MCVSRPSRRVPSKDVERKGRRGRRGSPKAGASRHPSGLTDPGELVQDAFDGREGAMGARALADGPSFCISQLRIGAVLHEDAHACSVAARRREVERGGAKIFRGKARAGGAGEPF
eukprot:1093256-Pleurochrysis_carterae.AAC.1